jgi:hypothetical protein
MEAIKKLIEEIRAAADENRSLDSVDLNRVYSISSNKLIEVERISREFEHRLDAITALARGLSDSGRRERIIQLAGELREVVGLDAEPLAPELAIITVVVDHDMLVNILWAVCAAARVTKPGRCTREHDDGFDLWRRANAGEVRFQWVCNREKCGAILPASDDELVAAINSFRHNEPVIELAGDEIEVNR